jgi:hypothetical protein
MTVNTGWCGVIAVLLAIAISQTFPRSRDLARPSNPVLEGAEDFARRGDMPWREIAQIPKPHD